MDLLLVAVTQLSMELLRARSLSDDNKIAPMAADQGHFES